MDINAQEIIALRDKLLSAQSNFRDLWQQTADLVFPRESEISTSKTAGEDKIRRIWDTTGIQASQDMASGLSASLIPSGQKFFGITVRDKELESDDDVRRYLQDAAEIVHEELFDSNFMLQLNESLRSLVVFGTCNLYSEWDDSVGGLNFKDFDIAMYQVQENNHGQIDTVVLSFNMTARQAVQEWGDKVSEDVKKAAESINDSCKSFPFIHIVRPRKERNVELSDSRNMPFESIYVDVKGKTIIDEGGFPEFPFAVARWMKSSSEIYGRGQGTEVMPDVKVLQRMKQDFIECANRWNNPPLEVLESFEGTPNISPRAINRVQQFPSIKAIEQPIMGNFPVTREMIEFQQEIIRKAFFMDIFMQLGGLTGDRRTTTEILERVREGMRRLALPIARLQSELFKPLITRCIMLLIRNGRIPRVPAQLAGKKWGLEYMGELSLALRNQQARGLIQWVSTVGELSAIFPEAGDHVDIDASIPFLAESYGVKTSHVASAEAIAAKRQARQEAMEAQQAMEAVKTGAGAYKDATKGPEEGSAAAELMGAMA